MSETAIPVPGVGWEGVATTFEAAAALDLLRIAGFITQEELDERENQLAGVSRRLTRLCQRYDTATKS